MITRIKICGITRFEDAALAVELGASALGFNFYPLSPRYITPENAGDIIRAVPPPVMTVGVFADESSVEHVLKVAQAASVSAVQWHGAWPDKAGRPAVWPRRYSMIRVVTVNEEFDPAGLRSLEAGAVLLDAPHPTLRGGTGRTIDWSKARAATPYARVILAGGLTAENVAEAVRQVRPFGVDVASGVELSPGVKDAPKLRAFFTSVREADRNHLP